MQPNTQPQAGSSITEQLEQYLKTELEALRKLLGTKGTRLSIVINGRKARKDIKTVVSFQNDSVLYKELYIFLEAYANKIASQLLIIRADQIRHRNIILINQPPASVPVQKKAKKS